MSAEPTPAAIAPPLTTAPLITLPPLSRADAQVMYMAMCSMARTVGFGRPGYDQCVRIAEMLNDRLPDLPPLITPPAKPARNGKPERNGKA